MAYALNLPTTLTEQIGRYAKEYPRDRLRDIAQNVIRKEIFAGFCKVHVRWELPVEQLALPKPRPLLDRLSLTWYNEPGLKGFPSNWKLLEEATYSCVRLSQRECEACEPYSLQLQRTAF